MFRNKKHALLFPSTYTLQAGVATLDDLDDLEHLVVWQEVDVITELAHLVNAFFFTSKSATKCTHLRKIRTYDIFSSSGFLGALFGAADNEDDLCLSLLSLCFFLDFLLAIEDDESLGLEVDEDDDLHIKIKIKKFFYLVKQQCLRWTYLEGVLECFLSLDEERSAKGDLVGGAAPPFCMFSII